jgi:hypothetical protein
VMRKTVGVGVGVLACLVLVAWVSQKPWSSAPTVGEQGRLGLPSGADAAVPVGSSIEGWERFVAANQAHDAVGREEVYRQGGIYTTRTGVRVLVLQRDVGRELLQVRILEGAEVGRAGWVPKRWVQRLAPGPV